jgi:hypothetical protein
VGQRVFDVSINGAQVLTNYDILGATGSMFKAIVEQFAARAGDDGRITIDFHPSATSPDQNAVVDGIELIPVSIGSRILTQPTSVAAVQDQSFSGTVATFLDTDPGGLARDYIPTTDWGDGSVTQSIIQPDPSGSGFDVMDSHTYTQDRRYKIAVTIQSYDGAAAEADDVAVVSAGLQSIGVPTAYTLAAGSSSGPIVLSTVTDAGPNANPKNFSATIAWGDGLTGSGTVVPAPGGYFVVGSHTYTQPGTFVPSVTIVAQNGASLATNNSTIVVTGPATTGLLAPAGSSGPTTAPVSDPLSVPISQQVTVPSPQHATARGSHRARKSVLEHAAKAKAEHASKSKGKHRAAPKEKAKLVVTVRRQRLGHSISLDLEELARDLLS